MLFTQMIVYMLFFLLLFTVHWLLYILKLRVIFYLPFSLFFHFCCFEKLIFLSVYVYIFDFDCSFNSAIANFEGCGWYITFPHLAGGTFSDYRIPSYASSNSTWFPDFCFCHASCNNCMLQYQYCWRQKAQLLWV